ncbi:MAG: flagellar biosynthesis anti-sigma factor FlgM [Firmicutes bacterium]|nr:flagellar biosynthesis anti-sigma factor FlgM [Bacillota bacterium]
MGIFPGTRYFVISSLAPTCPPRELRPAELRRYRKTLQVLPAVREEKVIAFRKALAAGEYCIDPYRTAEKMLEWSLGGSLPLHLRKISPFLFFL